MVQETNRKSVTYRKSVSWNRSRKHKKTYFQSKNIKYVQEKNHILKNILYLYAQCNALKTLFLARIHIRVNGIRNTRAFITVHADLWAHVASGVRPTFRHRSSTGTGSGGRSDRNTLWSPRAQFKPSTNLPLCPDSDMNTFSSAKIVPYSHAPRTISIRCVRAVYVLWATTDFRSHANVSREAFGPGIVPAIEYTRVLRKYVVPRNRTTVG